jgi:hypothetical protein
MPDHRFHERTHERADIRDQIESYEGTQLPFFEKVQKNLSQPLDIKALRYREEYINSVRRRIAQERAYVWESPHEIKKSPEMKQILEKAIEWVAREMIEMGYPLQVELSEERTHFLRSEQYNQLAQTEGSGFVLVAQNEVFISFDDNDESSLYFFENGFLDEEAENFSFEEKMKQYVDLLVTTIHEFTHIGGYQRFYATGYGYKVRTGYNAPNHEGEKFLSLNEAVVEKWAREIFKKNAHKLGISKLTQKYIEDFDFGAYNGDVNTLEAIIRGIAEKRGESAEIVWACFKEGYCSGSTKHLAEIETYFGKGTLKKYACLNPDDIIDDTDAYDELKQKIYNQKW